MELKDYLRIIRAYWRGVVALVLASIGIAAVLSLALPKVYSAQASGFVGYGGANRSVGEASVQDNLAKSRAASYVDIARSRATAEDVIRALGLTESPNTLVDNVTVQQPEDTVLVKITSRASSPEKAQRLADAWVAALARQVAAIEDPSNSGLTLRLVPIEQAALPTAPTSPNTRLNLALGLALGLLLGLGYALLRNQLDRRITTSDRFDVEFGVAVAGVIPASEHLSKARSARGSLVAANAEPSMIDRAPAEAFRKLRTNLQYMDVDNPPRVIVVTSPLPGDGKSTVAAHLAVALASTGEPTVLIDADLRRPVQADVFGLVEGVGLTEVLIGRVTFEDACQTVGSVPGLRVLGAGSIPPNPSEMLGSRTMKRLLAELGASNTVIVDAAPLLPVTDAAVLGAGADGVLIVVSSGKTIDSQLRDALGHLNAVQAHILGAVINRATRRPGSGYYGDTGYYGYAPTSETKQRTRRTSASSRKRSRT